MKDIITIIFISFIFVLFLSPYFSLWDLNDLGGIKDELDGIKKELEKLNEGIRKRN